MNDDEIITSSCKSDGLKKGMKLIIFEDLPPHEVHPLHEDHHGGEDLKIVGEVKVTEVSDQQSKAIILKELEAYNLNVNEIAIRLGTITR